MLLPSHFNLTLEVPRRHTNPIPPGNPQRRREGLSVGWGEEKREGFRCGGGEAWAEGRQGAADTMVSSRDRSGATREARRANSEGDDSWIPTGKKPARTGQGAGSAGRRSAGGGGSFSAS